jgi:phosphate-selective porin OprO/OprP
MRRGMHLVGRLLLTGLAAWLLAAGSARAEDSKEMDDLRRRLEALEQQNRELMQLLRKVQPPAQNATPEEGEAPADTPAPDQVKKIVADYLKEKEEAKKKEEETKKKEAEAAGWEIGKQVKMSATWYNGLWYLETEDKAFRFHVGGRTQMDLIWMGAQDSVEFGDNGTGPVLDGFNYRRARLEVDGTLWETIDFWCEYDFENTFNAERFDSDDRLVANSPVPTDLWITVTRLPWIGNVRVGNQKPPISFEHLTSSRFLNFLERSLAFDVWVGGVDNGFSPGIQAFNWFANERATWALGIFKNNNTVFGWNQGDGEWQVDGRMTFLPYYANQGRDLVHLGLGARFRTPDDNGHDIKEFRYRSRTLLRNGPAALHTVLADLRFNAENDVLIVPEFVMQFGPFLLDAEYFANFAQDVRFPSDSSDHFGNRFYQSFYVEALYFLTGENRTYNRVPRDTERVAIWDRVIPDENFFCVKSCDCRRLFGRGAWQVGARYSWLDLNDGPVSAGIIQDVTLGVNWFWNPNMKWQLNWIIEHRDVPDSDSGDGYIQGAGIRFAFDF